MEHVGPESTWETRGRCGQGLPQSRTGTNKKNPGGHHTTEFYRPGIQRTWDHTWIWDPQAQRFTLRDWLMEQNRPQPMKTMKKTTRGTTRRSWHFSELHLLKGERQKDTLNRVHGQERQRENQWATFLEFEKVISPETNMHIHNWCVHPNLNKQTFKHTHNMPELKHGTHTLTDEKKMHAMMFYDNFGNCYNCWYSIIRHFPLFSCNPGGVANWGISPRLEFKLKSFEVLVLRLLNRKTAQPVACETTQTPWALHWISIQVLWLPIHPG